MKINKFIDNALASYMAGLLESDGAIILKKKSNNEQEIERVTIKFSFNLHHLKRWQDDKGYAEFLRNFFKMGQVIDNKESYSTEWCIYALEDIYNFLLFINGYLRTAKIVTLNKAFNFFKKKYNIDTIVKPLDTSDFFSNSWFSGFSDGDSSFQITLFKQKNKLDTVYLKPYYQLEVAEFYLKNTEEYLDYKDNRIFMQPLAKTFNVNLLQRTRPVSQLINKETFKLKFNISKAETLILLIDYFTNFPLFSSKYLN